MKRRNIILTFAIIALLLVGVGYAALSDSLTVETNVSTATAELDLRISGVSATFADELIADVDTVVTVGADAENGGEAGDKATISYSGFKKAGDELVVVLSVLNVDDNDLAAKLTISSESEEKGYFDITYALNKTGESFDTAGNLIDGKATTLTVTITLLKTPVTTQNANFTVTVTGQGQEAVVNN